MFRGFGRSGVYTPMPQDPPVTRTDAYKLSMAESGAPLRIETFYYTHRRGGFNGWHYMPVDVSKFIHSLVPVPKKEDYDYLTQHGYEVGAAYRHGLTQKDLVIRAVPKGRWFYNREPAFSVKGTSVLSSWLEPTVLMLQYRIQLATDILTGSTGSRSVNATCEEEQQIILETFDGLGVTPPEVTVRSEDYYKTIFNRAKEILELLEDPSRAFEVGMRAVSCLAQHEIALQAIRAAGICRTSNVEAAQKLGMIPVGTMGHEHLQRLGSDLAGYRAMRDRFPGFLSYLLDTFDTIRSGIPAAFRVISEQPDRKAGIRFDSEKLILEQYLFAITRARSQGLSPYLTLESGWDFAKTREFEDYRKMLRWPSNLQGYGYGGYLVKPDWDTFDRDAVSAVYKLCQSGARPCMKFGDDPDSPKQSIPGEPVIWRPRRDHSQVTSIIAQEGETFPGHESFYRVDLEGGDYLTPIHRPNTIVRMSPETLVLIDQCQTWRENVIQEASGC